MDQHLPAKKAGAATDSTAGSQAEQPIDFSPIQNLDIRGSLRLGDLTMSNIKAKDVRIDLRAKNGRLDGAIKGIDLAKSLRNAKALLSGGKREDQPGAAAGEKTDFSELTASFDIKNGIAHNGDFLAKSPFLRLTGEGDVNLPQSSLNYLAKVSAVASSAGQGGKETADLKGLTVPVRASGPFTALKYKLEFGSLLSDSAKQELDEQKDVIKGKLEEKLRSKLLGKPGGPAAPAPGDERPPGQAPASQPGREDKLKEKLKKLF